MASFKGHLAIITISKIKEQCNREKTEMDLNNPPDIDILVKYVL